MNCGGGRGGGEGGADGGKNNRIEEKEAEGKQKIVEKEDGKQ